MRRFVFFGNCQLLHNQSRTTAWGHFFKKKIYSLGLSLDSMDDIQEGLDG